MAKQWWKGVKCKHWTHTYRSLCLVLSKIHWILADFTKSDFHLIYVIRAIMPPKEFKAIRKECVEWNRNLPCHAFNKATGVCSNKVFSHFVKAVAGKHH